MYVLKESFKRASRYSACNLNAAARQWHDEQILRDWTPLWTVGFPYLTFHYNNNNNNNDDNNNITSKIPKI
jgi:hypothetical protein